MLACRNCTAKTELICHVPEIELLSFCRQIDELTTLKDGLASNLAKTEQRLADSEAENEELFSKVTAAEEEADAANGKLFVVQKELTEAEDRIKELSEAHAQVRTVAVLPEYVHLLVASLTA